MAVVCIAVLLVGSGAFAGPAQPSLEASSAEILERSTKQGAMADQTPGAFEQKIARLEAIVKELENGNVELDRAVQLFKEGKALSADCETLLKGAQEQIDRAMEQSGAPAPSADDEVPF